MLFSGTGDWNGRSGYVPSVGGRDRVTTPSRMQIRAFTITAPNGAVVARVERPAVLAAASSPRVFGGKFASPEATSHRAPPACTRQGARDFHVRFRMFIPRLLVGLLVVAASASRSRRRRRRRRLRLAGAGACAAEAADARRHPARRVRALPREQRSALLPPRRPHRSGEEVDRRQEHDPLQDAQGRHAASSSISTPTSNVDKILLGDDAAEVRARDQHGLRRLSPSR